MGESFSGESNKKSYPFSDAELARMNAGEGGNEENDDFVARGHSENLSRFHEAMKKISGTEILGIAFDPAIKNKVGDDEETVYGQLMIKTSKGDITLALVHDHSYVRHGHAVSVVAKYPNDENEEKSEIDTFAME